jgi:TRAP-type C4-dicarboxylate transport system permease small subunit
MRVQDRLLKIAGRLQRIQLWLAVCALVALMMVTVTDVFMRYLFNRPVRGSFDAVEGLLLVFVFNSMAATFFGRRNVVIDVIDSFVPRAFAGMLIRLADILSVVILGLLAWAMLVPAAQSFAYGELKQDLGLPIFILWFIAIASLAGTIFCAAAVALGRPVTDSGTFIAEYSE